MADRMFVPIQGTLEKKVVKLFARVTFGASGAPTLVTANSKGFASVARNSAGDFTLKLQDNYQRILALHYVLDESGNSGAVPAAPNMYLKANSVTSGSFEVVFTAPTSSSVTTQVATDPANGEAVYIELQLSNSTAL